MLNHIMYAQFFPNVCNYVYMYVCLHAYSCMYMCIQSCTYVCTCVCMYVYVCVCVCMNACMYMYVCVCMCVYVCVYVCSFVCNMNVMAGLFRPTRIMLSTHVYIYKLASDVALSLPFSSCGSDDRTQRSYDLRLGALSRSRISPLEYVWNRVLTHP